MTRYGLCNAGTSYQRMIDIMLSDLPSERVLAYMDEIVIYSKSINEYLEGINQVFSCLRSLSIKLKLSKCVFARKQVDFLGFTLSAAGIRHQSRLIEAIDCYQVPDSKKSLKGFFSLAGFYHSIIPNFAHVSQLLNILTSKDILIV